MLTMTPCNTIDEIPRLNIKNKSYILEGLLRNKFLRNRYFWVWQYGTGVLDVENQLKPYWLCNICDEQHKITLFNADTTSNSLAHLRTHHRIYKSDVESPSEESEKTSSVRGQYIRYPCEAHGQRRRHVTPPITRSRQPPQGQPSFSS